MRRMIDAIRTTDRWDRLLQFTQRKGIMTADSYGCEFYAYRAELHGLEGKGRNALHRPADIPRGRLRRRHVIWIPSRAYTHENRRDTCMANSSRGHNSQGGLFRPPLFSYHEPDPLLTRRLWTCTSPIRPTAVGPDGTSRVTGMAPRILTSP